MIMIIITFGFNRSILECKLNIAANNAVIAAGFNRSILECKRKRQSHHRHPQPALIDPYWNVNEAIVPQDARIKQALIDPYWNVNHVHLRQRHYVRRALIDPYWNVNDNRAAWSVGDSRL